MDCLPRYDNPLCEGETIVLLMIDFECECECVQIVVDICGP